MSINIGDEFGNWKVIGIAVNEYVKCECQCDNHTVKYIILVLKIYLE